MTGRDLMDALGDVDSRLILDAAPARQPEKGRSWRRWAAMAAAVLLVIGMGIWAASGYWQQNEPTVDLEQVQWAKDAQVAAVPSVGNSEWNGWTMDHELLDAIGSAQEQTVLAVRVWMDSSVTLSDFEYEGSTYDKLQGELSGCWNKMFALNALYQMRDLLKYGEALYTTGTPDGIKWTEDQYRYTVAYVGKKAVEKYFVGGEFQHNLWQQDVAALEEEIDSLAVRIEELVAVYEEEYLEKERAKFARAGVCAVTKNGGLYLFVTKGELAELKVARQSKYVLHLAGRRAYEYSPRDTREAPARVDAGVTGFACEKIGISTVQGCKTGALKSDIQIIQAVNDLIKLYQYTCDGIMVTIGADAHLPEEVLQDMNYSRISYDQYPTRTVLLIRYEDINMEALKDLSNREDVDYIHISEPLITINVG